MHKVKIDITVIEPKPSLLYYSYLFLGTGNGIFSPSRRFSPCRDEFLLVHYPSSVLFTYLYECTVRFNSSKSL